ncbi:hypothetical protein S40293_11201 [Stachybotrys chartarum IBT 40293]|nr:hypothetical protein S40293_11201 [Stachybotrys chartarum IBT 40293]KFA71798.1 hypothetical protein S40288_11260 [Stachybotrys chartarum IBT 40288]
MENSFVIANSETHVMRRSLVAYVNHKVHASFANKDITSILVSGSLQKRSSSPDGQFDCRRPVVSNISPTEIRLDCFPSQNLCFHYASLVGTYLSLNNRNPSIVRLSPPGLGSASDILNASNLQDLGHVDIAIIGHVHHLEQLSPGPWSGQRSDAEYEIFRWRTFVSASGKTIALLGCLEKIWGDASYNLIHSIHAQSGIGCVIYIAKAGALSAKHHANEWIASGQDAYLEGEHIKWRSPLMEILRESQKVATGTVVTVPTTLCETHEWLDKWSPKADWVDCEIGYMATASIELGIEFGFLHIISDNLHHSDGEGLHNEETPVILEKRRLLYHDIMKILEKLVHQ